MSTFKLDHKTCAMVAAHVLCNAYDLRGEDGTIVQGDSHYRAVAVKNAALLAVDLVEAVGKVLDAKGA